MKKECGKVKIQSLELINFRNHPNTFMVFDKVNYIIGSNNSGKSTIRGALQYAITGENEWAVNGRQSKNLIMHGKKNASVEAGVEGIGLIKRTINNSGNLVTLNDNKLPARELEKEIYNDFGLTNEIINCVIMSSKFLNMSPAEQKDFLFRLTGAILKPEQIIGFMKEPSEKAKEAVLKMVGSRVSIEKLDGIYKKFYEERRFKKKEKERIEKSLELLGEVPFVSSEDVSRVKKLIETKTKKREEIMKKVAVINERIKQKKWLETSLEEVEQKIESIDERLDKSIVISDAEEILFGYVTEINRLEEEIEKCKAVFNTFMGEIKSLEAILPKLSTTRCPLSEKLICKTDKTSLIKELETQIDTNKKEMTEIKSKESSLQKQLNKTKEAMEKLELQVELFVKMEELQQNKEQITKALGSIKIEDESSLVRELDKYDKEINELDERMQIYNEQVRAKKEFDSLMKELAKVAEEVELYEYLVVEFSPKGVKQRILEKIIEPIEKHCNDILSILTDDSYKLKFSFDGDFDILIENKSGVMSYKLLSNSEKFRIGIVIQDAINNLTNAKLLFIDDAEMLDDGNFQLLQELISKIKDSYDSIFVIATMDSDETLSGIDDSKVFKITDGVVEEI